MSRLERLLLAACVAVVAAGSGAALTGLGKSPTAVPPGTPSASPVSSTAPSSPLPPPQTTIPASSSSVLETGLLDPTDLGGYYRVNRAAGAELLHSAACLGPLGPSSGPVGEASEGLVGPDEGGLPFIGEIVASYPGSAAAGVYGSLNAALRACHLFSADIAGALVRVPLQEGAIAQRGEASSEFGGSFSAGGRQETLQIGLALQGADVICVVWVDLAAGTNPIMGDLPSTLSAAIGKLA